MGSPLSIICFNDATTVPLGKAGRIPFVRLEFGPVERWLLLGLPALPVLVVAGFAFSGAGGDDEASPLSCRVKFYLDGHQAGSDLTVFSVRQMSAQTYPLEGVAYQVWWLDKDGSRTKGMGGWLQEAADGRDRYVTYMDDGEHRGEADNGDAFVVMTGHDMDVAWTAPGGNVVGSTQPCA